MAKTHPGAQAFQQIILTVAQAIQQNAQIGIDTIQQATPQIPTTGVKKNLKRAADGEQINRSHKLPRKL